MLEFALKLGLHFLLIPIGIFILLKFIVPIVLKTKTDIDDIVIGIVYKPLLFLSLFYALYKVFTINGVYEIGGLSIFVTFRVIRTLVWLYLIWRLVYKEFISYYLVKLADETESGIDDILVPIIKIVFPLLYVILGGIWILNLLGVNTSGWGVVVGGASFVLAFALQNILGDIFAGIALLADTPFQKGDILRIGDQLLEVKKIGMRVTEFYVFEDHTTIFISNSKLAQEDIVNLTYPTADVRVHMKIGVAYGTDARKVKELLLDIAAANPYILGKPSEKIDAMKRLLAKLEAKSEDMKYAEEKRVLKWGIKKWELEDKLLALIESLRQKSLQLISYINSVEQDGITKDEILEIEQKLKHDLEPVVMEICEVMRQWKNVILQDPNLFPSDIPVINKYWELKIKRLEKHWRSVLNFVNTLDLSSAQRIDTKIEEFVEWLLTRFKDPYEPWKDPDVEFDNFGDSAIVFEFEFFVDDIKSERYERLDRVQADILLAVYEAFMENDIEIPFPQQDVWFRNELVIKERSAKK